MGFAVVIIAYALLVWDRRWISDDGLIFVRCVREILEGNGPVYSPFERAEPCTSTLWMWLLAGCCWITNTDVARTAVALGGVLAVAGFAIAVDGSRRLHRRNGHAGELLPAGALVVIAIFPFWDFATSGLETGLAFFWLASIWWLLVALRRDSGRRQLLVFAVVVGLGPLVRPDFTLVTIVLLVAGWRIAKPSRWLALRLIAAAFALPVAYEVFRAGYYGVLVPLPALAKSASDVDWSRGLDYLVQFAKPQFLYIPIVMLAAMAFVERRSIIAAAAAVVAVPVIAGVMLAVFVVRVGGDFMYARMLLPSTLLVLAPVLLVPRTRITTIAVLAVAAWAMFTGFKAYTTKRRVPGDERADYVRITQQRNPTSAEDHVAVVVGEADDMAAALRDRRRLLFSDGSIPVIALNHAIDAPIAIATGRLGFAGAIAPLDGVAVDLFGLSNPIGARITRTWPGRTGHEKRLPLPWVLADFADPSATTDVPTDVVRAARHAMTCGALAELLASVREPMTASRFWDNLTGSWSRTRLVIPADPLEAEREFCEP